MAASMWRMNGFWRKMAGVVLLCALLLSNEVLCQADPGTDPSASPAVDPVADAGSGSAVTDAPTPKAASVPDVGVVTTPPATVGEESSTPTAAVGDPLPVTHVSSAFNSVNLNGAATGPSATTAAPIVGVNIPATAEVPKDSQTLTDVMCVGQDEISNNSIKVEVNTTVCEETKRIILENPEGWCQETPCDLKIFQNGKTALVASDNAQLSSLAAAFQSETVKNKLGVSNVESPVASSPSSNSSVFVGILVSGLLAALAITVGYFKCQRRSDSKGVRLAEEAYPVDQENQGNTLVSVAPLNPPADTQVKPSVNGESNEAAKTQPPPPTNGHSTANTADTEM